MASCILVWSQCIIIPPTNGRCHLPQAFSHFLSSEWLVKTTLKHCKDLIYMYFYSASLHTGISIEGFLMVCII